MGVAVAPQSQISVVETLPKKPSAAVSVVGNPEQVPELKPEVDDNKKEKDLPLGRFLPLSSPVPLARFLSTDTVESSSGGGSETPMKL